jgi:hypothetical protein
MDGRKEFLQRKSEFVDPEMSRMNMFLSDAGSFLDKSTAAKAGAERKESRI